MRFDFVQGLSLVMGAIFGVYIDGRMSWYFHFDDNDCNDDNDNDDNVTTMTSTRTISSLQQQWRIFYL